MHQDHPNLSPEINRNIKESELAGGIKWDELPVGSVVEAQSKNTLYTIEKREDGTYISGNSRFCPTPTKASIHGSTWGGSMLKMGWIGVGMHLEFSIDESGPITTTTLQDVRVKS